MGLLAQLVQGQEGLTGAAGAVLDAGEVDPVSCKGVHCDCEGQRPKLKAQSSIEENGPTMYKSDRKKRSIKLESCCSCNAFHGIKGSMEEKKNEEMDETESDETVDDDDDDDDYDDYEEYSEEYTEDEKDPKQISQG